MASWPEHELECKAKLGKPFAEVHKYLDQWHGMFGGHHRFMLHHQEGIEEVREKFGDEAAEAARVHIIQDMTHVPKKDDYKNGRVDWLGYPNKVKYTVVDKRQRDED